MATKKKNRPNIQAQNKTGTPVKQKATVTARSKASVKREPFINTSDIVPLLFIVIYFCVDFCPFFDSADIMGPQWIYLVIANVVTAGYIFFNKKESSLAITTISKNILAILYAALFVVAALSIFGAMNKIESYICFGRFATTFFAFVNMAILLYNRTNLFRIVAQVLAIILLFEGIDIISQFFKGLNSTTPLDQVIYDLKGNSGNKNIMAASLAFKVPFAIYCIHSFKLVGKILNIIALALGAMAIFFINARSAFLGLMLVTLIYIAFCVYQHLKEKNARETGFRIGSAFLPVLISFLLSQYILHNAVEAEKLEGRQSTYGTVTDRLESITAGMGSTSLRMKQVASAVDYILGGTGKVFNRIVKDTTQSPNWNLNHNPLRGAGIGNWKLVSTPYERSFSDEMYITYHVHNDFLETTAELGPIGGLLFLSLFVCMAVFTIKTLRSATASQKSKQAAVFSLMAAAAYFTDAGFNFPSERPIMQTFFALMLAINLNAFLSGKKSEEKQTSKTWTRPVLALATLAFMIPASYTTYENYKSMVAQNLYNSDMLSGSPVHHSWEVMPMLPEIPNLNVFGFPIDAIKARYLYADKKYDSAIYYLNRSMNVNPYISYNEFMKGNIFRDMGKLDSAYYWAKKCFFMKPRAKSNYQLFSAVLQQMALQQQKKDTAMATTIFREALKFRNEPWIWGSYLVTLNTCGKDAKTLLALTDSASKLFPNDTEFSFKKNHDALANFIQNQPK